MTTIEKMVAALTAVLSVSASVSAVAAAIAVMVYIELAGVHRTDWIVYVAAWVASMPLSTLWVLTMVKLLISIENGGEDETAVSIESTPPVREIPVYTRGQKIKNVIIR